MNGLLAASSGFLTGATLIVAIGAQNLFVLRQGLQRRHVGAVVLFCGLADAVLVTAGVAGAGTALRLAPSLTGGLRLAGAVFLLVYGAMALRRAVNATSLRPDGMAVLSLSRTLATAGGFTFLNPHVYLDTVVLMGVTGTRFPLPAQPFFIAGAAVASFGWFSLIGFGARALSPMLARPGTWRAVDVGVGLTMLALALSLAARSPVAP